MIEVLSQVLCLSEQYVNGLDVFFEVRVLRMMQSIMDKLSQYCTPVVILTLSQEMAFN